MSAAALSEVRSKAFALVSKAETATGSRMLAYEQVGQTVGASGMWVRRFIKKYEGVGLDWVVGQNIIARYAAICNRVESNNEALRRDIQDAADQSGFYQPLATPEAVAGKEEGEK